MEQRQLEKLGMGGVIMLKWALGLFIIMASSIGIAQVTTPPTEQEWLEFFRAIGGWQGLGTLGLVALVVQGLMLAIRGFLGNLVGKWKLVILSGLTLIGGVLALRIGGADWASALMHSTTLIAFQVFLHQLWKHITK